MRPHPTATRLAPRGRRETPFGFGTGDAPWVIARRFGSARLHDQVGPMLDRIV